MNGLWLVARREILAQVRTKAFVIGLLISVVVVAAFAVMPKVFGGPDSYNIGRVQAQELPVKALAGDAEVTWREFPDEAAAKQAVLDGDVDAALVANGRVLTDGEIDEQLGLLMQSANREAQIGSAGVRITPLAMESVGVDTRYEGARRGIATVIVLLLFFMIMSSVMAVAMGVVEEKGSRIVEILLTSIRPWQLLGGKIVGLGIVGLINLTVVGGAGLVAAILSGVATDFPPGMGGVVANVLIWFLVGYAFFAALAGALASLVSRQEEVGNVLQPMMMLLLAAYGVSFFASVEPTGTMTRIVSFIPPFSSMVMPVRAAATPVPVWEIALSGALMIAAVIAMLMLGARIYQRAVLRTGARVRIGDVLRP